METDKILAPFTFRPNRSVEVLELSLEFLKSSGWDAKIRDLGWAYQCVGDLVPHTAESLWSGHFFPWVESWEDIQISCNLCLFGLYKQAMTSLRSGLELGLLSVYWNLHDDGHEVIAEWLRSNEDTPRMGEIWRTLTRHANFKWFADHYDLQSDLLSLGYLHNFIHTKGYRFSNSMGVAKSNWQTYEENAFETWFTGYAEVVRVLAICHLVKYPLGTYRFPYSAKFGIEMPWIGGLQGHKIDWLEKLVGSDTFALIAELLEQDPQAQATIGWVRNLPDMSEEDVEGQIVEMDRDYIQMNGLNAWLEVERKTTELAGLSEKRKRRIAMLTEWAKEKGFDASR